MPQTDFPEIAKMWMKVVVLAVLTSESLALKRTRHYIQSPFGNWHEFDSGYQVQSVKANGRVEVLEKILTRSQLDSGTLLNEKVVNHAKKSSDIGDIIATIVDPKLGGHGHETFNAIPMNPATQDIWTSKVVEPIHNYLVGNESREIFFACMLFYDTIDSIRPNGIATFVTIGVLTNIHLVKGYVPNPRKSSGTVVPYLYSTGLERAIRISGTTYHRLEVKGDLRRSWRVRVEKAERSVTLSDLNRGTEIDEINRIHARKLTSKEEDVPGQLISKTLGGRGDDPYNVVPMDPTALVSFKRFEVSIRAFLRNSGDKDLKVVQSILVVYEDKISTRPAGFIAISRVLDYGFKMFIPN